MDTPSNNSPLSAEWQTWIADNLARGCEVSAMAEMMVRNRFDANTARENIARVQQSLLTSAAYVYDTPRFPAAGNVIHTPDRAVRVSARLFKPVVAVLDDLLSGAECDELIRLSRIKLKRSTIVDPSTGQEAVIEARTSSGTFIARNETEFIATLERRIAAAMHWPADHGEGLQILNYQVGAEYKAHYDYFPVADPGSAVHLAKGGQRVSTLVIYLNDVEAAGETLFPEVGLSVTPKKGSAVYFEYSNSRGQVDPLTLHCGVPVAAGEKWIATKWMRQGRYE